jgi:membrane-associated phospholipid phosphatase
MQKNYKNMKKNKPFFCSPLLIASHVTLLIALLLWFNPITHLFFQHLDEIVFLKLNGSLVDKPFWQVFWGLLNDRRETKLNLLFAALINIWAIGTTQNKVLRHQRLKQTVYFWICFQIGFMLQEGIFNSWLHVTRNSPSLVFTPIVKLSQVLQNYNLKESTQHSFPSGHAFSLIYWASFTLLCAPRRIGIIGLVFAIILCLPRLFIGAHWLSDEVFSILIAVIWLSWTVNNPIYHKITLLKDLPKN